MSPLCLTFITCRYVLTLPAKDRYEHVSLLVSSNGHSVKEICSKISLHMLSNVCEMLNVIDDDVLTYALRPEWEKYVHLLKGQAHIHCQTHSIPVCTGCAHKDHHA